MSSEFGRTLRVGVFGQSHGAAIGVSIDGLPAGERIDLAELQAFLDRRRPGKSPLSTARKEADAPEFLSGLRDGVTCGSPLCAVIYNSDQHSSDYTELADKPRPSHADYTAWVKWGGQADMRGGGHFSGRLTAPLCIAGGIAKQILARRGVFVGAHLAAVGTEDDEAFRQGRGVRRGLRRFAPARKRKQRRLPRGGRPHRHGDEPRRRHPRRHHHRYAAHAARRHQADAVHRQTAENGLARADGKHRADYPGPSRPLHRAPRRARR